MIQRRGGARLLLESMEAIGIGRDGRGQDLDGHVTPEPCVARAVHLAHAAGAEGRHDLVRTEPVTRLQPHRNHGRL